MRAIRTNHIDYRRVKKFFEDGKLEALLQYVDELCFQSYQNGITEGVSYADEAQNRLLKQLLEAQGYTKVPAPQRTFARVERGLGGR